MPVREERTARRYDRKDPLHEGIKIGAGDRVDQALSRVQSFVFAGHLLFSGGLLSRLVGDISCFGQRALTRLQSMALEESRQNRLILGTDGFRGGQLRLLIHEARRSGQLKESNEASCITLERFVEGHLYDRVHLGNGACPIALPDSDLFFERLSDRGPKIRLTAGTALTIAGLTLLELRALRRL